MTKKEKNAIKRFDKNSSSRKRRLELENIKSTKGNRLEQETRSKVSNPKREK